MASFFERIFGRKTQGSSSKAKDRLQFVLVHDRINLSPERMQEMKEEILAVISKYVTVDRSSVDIALEQRDNRHGRLVAEIPVMQSRATTNLDEDDDLRATTPPEAKQDEVLSEDVTVEDVVVDEQDGDSVDAEADDGAGGKKK